MTTRASCLSNILMMGAPSEQVPAWLNHVTLWYNALSDDEKNCVLDNLISISGPPQMYMLSKKFPDLLFRDFVSMLPPEISAMILEYLPGEELLACCLVSKVWYVRVSSLAAVWARIARSHGVVTPVISKREIGDFSVASSTKLPSVAECESTISVRNPSFAGEMEDDEEMAAKSVVCSTEMTPGGDGLANCELIQGDSNTENSHCEQDYSLGHEVVTPGSVYKSMFCHAKRVMQGFSTGATVHINQDFIDKGVWRVTSVRYYKGFVVTGCDDHTVQIWSIPEGKVINTVSTHSVCCLTITDTHLYTASFNANAESWDLKTGLHTRTFCGHTSAVLAIDVTADQHFLLTGSVDKTAKLWDLTRSGNNQLVKTFDDTHMDWVFQVKFLSVAGDDLLFVTCDSNVCCLWRTNALGCVRAASHVTADSLTKFTSFYHDPENPHQLFACLWTEETKSSAFCEYSLTVGSTQIQKRNSFRIDLSNIKAFLLGAGTRFAVIMCSISRKDFHIIDIPKQSVVATIATPDFYVLTRNGSTVTLCDTSWLNGFQFSSMTGELPVFAAGIALNKVMLGTWAEFVSKFAGSLELT